MSIPLDVFERIFKLNPSIKLYETMKQELENPEQILLETFSTIESLVRYGFIKYAKIFIDHNKPWGNYYYIAIQAVDYNDKYLLKQILDNNIIVTEGVLQRIIYLDRFELWNLLKEYEDIFIRFRKPEGLLSEIAGYGHKDILFDILKNVRYNSNTYQKIAYKLAQNGHTLVLLEFLKHYKVENIQDIVIVAVEEGYKEMVKNLISIYKTDIKELIEIAKDWKRYDILDMLMKTKFHSLT